MFRIQETLQNVTETFPKWSGEHTLHKRFRQSETANFCNLLSNKQLIPQTPPKRASTITDVRENWHKPADKVSIFTV
jgi:hypothetical protein